MKTANHRSLSTRILVTLGWIYNTAIIQAQEMIASAIECQKKTLEELELDINRQAVEAFWGPYQEQPGRVRKLKRYSSPTARRFQKAVSVAQ